MLIEQIELAVLRVGVRLPVHPTQTGLHDVAEFVAERGVVGHNCRVGAGQQLAVSVLVLKSFAVECGPSSRGAEDESASHLVTCGPECVARALEAEHRVEDVNRNHRNVVRGVRRSHRGERRDRTGLVDAFVQDATGLRFLVGQHQFPVHRRVLLAVRGVNLERREQRIHAKGAGLVGDDRHEVRTHSLVLDEVLEESDECHRGSNRLLARAPHDSLVSRVRRLGERFR